MTAPKHRANTPSIKDPRAPAKTGAFQDRKASTRAHPALTLGPIRRLLLLGGGDLLVGLAEQGRDLGLEVDVLTSPRHAKEAVRGGRRLADALTALGLEPAVVADFDRPETAARIGDMSATFALSVGAAWIFRRDKIDGWFDGKLFNLHGTRLPQNRGGGGYSWQILMGNRFGFCQLHRVDGGLDTGPIMASEEFIFPHSCRVPRDFADYAAERNLSFMGDLLGAIRDAACDFTLSPQPEYLSTYWPRVHTPTQAWIDWRWRAPEIERFICAFDEPYPGAQTTWRGQTVRLKRAFANAEDGGFHPFQAGLVYRNNGRWLCIACDGGAIVAEQIESESGESLMASVSVGDAFVTSSEQLLKRTQRLHFDAHGLKLVVSSPGAPR
jgi:methionyl-tRNA formyltransferase